MVVLHMVMYTRMISTNVSLNVGYNLGNNIIIFEPGTNPALIKCCESNM